MNKGWQMVYGFDQEIRTVNLGREINAIVRKRRDGLALLIHKDARPYVVRVLGEPIREAGDTREGL